MIVGIGVDIAETVRFEKLYGRYGDRFVRRILNDKEQKDFARRRNPVSFLATRFAAKEAASKALGTGFNEEVNYKSIEISNDTDGKPVLRFLHRTSALASKKNINSIFISISDESHYAVAMVILEN